MSRRRCRSVCDILSRNRRPINDSSKAGMSTMSDDDSSVPPPKSAVVVEGKVAGTLTESTTISPQKPENIRLVTPRAGADPRSPLGAATASPSSRWGALELRRKIADGGFGTVYLAWDPALEREVRSEEHTSELQSLRHLV